MGERDFATQIDRYFRREDTILTKVLRYVSPKSGKEYRGGSFKRITDTVFATPLALATLPLVTALSLVTKLEDGGSAFYIQNRIGRDGETVPVIKVRCMRMGADSDVRASLTNASVFGEENDPRNTRFGSFMRKFELEELPQLWQVAFGQLSLIDIRSAPQYVIDYIREERFYTYKEWKKAYLEGKPGLFSLNSAMNEQRKNDLKRHHYDLLYSRRASLGLDLFILYRTGVRMLRRLAR